MAVDSRQSNFRPHIWTLCICREFYALILPLCDIWVLFVGPRPNPALCAYHEILIEFMHFIMHICENEMPNDAQTNFTAVNSFDKRYSASCQPPASSRQPPPANCQLPTPSTHTPRWLNVKESSTDNYFSAFWGLAALANPFGLVPHGLQSDIHIFTYSHIQFFMRVAQVLRLRLPFRSCMDTFFTLRLNAAWQQATYSNK